MGRFSALRTIKSFATTDLPRLLSQFEQNIREKFESDNARAFGPFTPTALRNISHFAQSWELDNVDPSSGVLRVNIPSPREPGVGWIVVKNGTTNTNTITVEPIGGTIDGFQQYFFSGAYAATFLAPDAKANNWVVIPRDAGGGITPPIPVSDLAPGTTGYVLKTIGGVATWVPDTGGGVWETLLDADLTTGGTSAFTVNGQTITRGGIGWTCDNIANATQIEFNGSGFQVTHNASLTRYGGLAVGTKGPVIRANLQALGPLSGFARGPLRAQFRFSLANATTNFQFAKLGLEQTQNSRWCGAYAAAGFSGAVVVGGELYGGLTGLFTQTDAIGSSDVAEVRIYPTWAADFSFGAFGADWPVVTNPIGTAALIQDDASTTQIGTVLSRDAGAANSNHIDVAIAAQNTLPGGPSGFQVTVSHVRIQQFRTNV